jgi:hypothetical protein
MNRYLRGVDAVTGASRSIVRIADVLGSDSRALSPAPAGPLASASGFWRELRDSAPAEIRDGVGTLAGAAVGLILEWRTHPYLGAIGGASLGRNVPALLRPEDRRAALRNMGVTGAAVLVSLLVPRHPAAGFAAGWLAASAALYAGGVR